MANWIRDYRILAGVPGRDGFLIGMPENGRAIHVSFDLEKSDSESSNTGKVTISNLSDAHKAILNEKGCVMEISVGYEGSIHKVFVGNVSSTTETLNNADRDIEIELVDGFSNYDKPGSVSYSGIVPCDLVLYDVIEKMGVESVVITPFALEKLAIASYDNGYCYVGKLKAALQAVCQKAGVTFSLQGGVLQVYAYGEPVSSDAYVLNSSTGLISIPKKITISQSTTGTAVETEEGDSTVDSGIPGYEVEYFINGAIGVNDLIVLESQMVSGVFRVHSQHLIGDNYEGDWKCTAELVEPTMIDQVANEVPKGTGSVAKSGTSNRNPASSYGWDNHVFE